MLRIMQILLPRVCSCSVHIVVVWLQFLKQMFSNTFSLVLFARLVSVASTQGTPDYQRPREA